MLSSVVLAERICCTVHSRRANRIFGTGGDIGLIEIIATAQLSDSYRTGAFCSESFETAITYVYATGRFDRLAQGARGTGMMFTKFPYRLHWGLFLLGWLLFQPVSVRGQEREGWRDLPPIPVAKGLGGPVVGVHQGRLIVGGGANFPTGAPWDTPPGSKVWHSELYSLSSAEGTWQSAGELPVRLAYSVCVSTPRGVVLLGGEEDGQALADVWLLKWQDEDQSVSIERLADLPRPMAYHAGALMGDRIYIAYSSRTSTDGPFNEKKFWSVSLAELVASRWDETQAAPPQLPDLWQEHPVWPGAPRHKAVAAVQRMGNRDQFYLISGENPWMDAEGKPVLDRFEYLADGYRFDAKENRWTRIADLPAVPERRADVDAERWADFPKPVAAAASAPFGQSDILVFSGSTGRYITRPSPEIPAFPTDVLCYHTITDTWHPLPPMPIGVVTTTAVNWPDLEAYPVQPRIVIPSGETQPAVRTPQVQMWTPPPAKRSLGWINLTVIGVYLGGLVLLGVYFSKREKGTDDFFLAGRRIPWWAAGLSIYATQLSAITYVSIPATAYSQNWLTFIGQCSIPIMVPLFIFCYLPFYRRLQLTTVYEYLEQRFHRVVRWYGSLSFVGFQLARMAMVVYLPAIALSAVTGWGVVPCILVMGILSTLYTVLGGIEAVIWTDVLQVFVLWGGILVAAVLAVSGAGGWEVTQQITSQYEKWQWFEGSTHPAVMSTWAILIGSCFLQFGPYTTDQAVVQRYLTTPHERDAARGLWLNAILAIPFSIVFFAVGTFLFAYFHETPGDLDVGMQNDRVLPLFVLQQLPVGLSGLVIAGIFAASMSTMDSSIHSIATTLSHDFYKIWRPNASPQASLRVARILTLVAGVAGTASALLLASMDIQSVFLFFQKALGLVSSALAGVFILGIFTRRANAAGALAGAASCVAVLYLAETQTDWVFYWHSVLGILTCVSVGYVASLLTPQLSRDTSGLCWWTRTQADSSADH
jgi:SSS family solute:Na+ symporter